jgi:hypothetical protein
VSHRGSQPPEALDTSRALDLLPQGQVLGDVPEVEYDPLDAGSEDTRGCSAFRHPPSVPTGELMNHERHYRPEILERLRAFAIFPRVHTDPVMVRDFIKALHTMEIRTIRVEQQKAERRGDRSTRNAYREKVIALREKYEILSIPANWWIEVKDGKERNREQ